MTLTVARRLSAKEMSRSELESLLADHLVCCSNVDAMPLDVVHRMLERDSFACIRGLVNPDDVARSRETWMAAFDSSKDRPLDPERPEQVRRNFQCVINRTRRELAVGRPQLLRAFYNPLWEEDVFGMHGMFKVVARLRNVMMGLPSAFALDSPEKGLWTASRIYQYPRGGGFMIPHRDRRFVSVPAEVGASAYYQSVLVMSRKGVDYQEGGGYFVRDGKRVFFEDVCELGDVVVYDDRIPHGVQEIDPTAPLDLTSPLGRLAAFANLFRVA